MNHNATAYSGTTPTYGTGKFGNALTGGLLLVAGSLDSPSGVGSVEGWFSTTSTNFQFIGGINGGSQSTLVGCNFGTQGGKFLLQLVGGANGGGTYSSISTVNDGAQHYFLINFDGTTATVYVDGKLPVLAAVQHQHEVRLPPEPSSSARRATPVSPGRAPLARSGSTPSSSPPPRSPPRRSLVRPPARSRYSSSTPTATTPGPTPTRSC